MAPVNDEAKKHNQNLPGMGGIYNTVNFHLYHYAGNNPIKYTDPTGRSSVDEESTNIIQIIDTEDNNRSTENSNIPILNGSREEFLQTQRNLIGTNYVWGGNDPEVDGGVDCSGGILYGINQMDNALGDQRAHDIYNNYTIPVADGDMQPGDLRFIDYNDDMVMDHVQTILDVDGSRINPTGGPENTLDNPGSIQSLPGPLPASGVIRRLRFRGD